MTFFNKPAVTTRHVAIHKDDMRKRRGQMERLRALRLGREAEEVAGLAMLVAHQAVSKNK